MGILENDRECPYLAEYHVYAVPLSIDTSCPLLKCHIYALLL